MLQDLLKEEEEQESILRILDELESDTKGLWSGEE